VGMSVPAYAAVPIDSLAPVIVYYEGRDVGDTGGANVPR